MLLISVSIKQFYFHDKNFDKLHEIVGRQCLPVEYGGLSESILDQQFSDEFLSRREAWFNHNIKQKYGYIDSTGSGNEEDDVWIDDIVFQAHPEKISFYGEYFEKKIITILLHCVY